MKKIQVSGSTDGANVPVRYNREMTQSTVQLSITLPKELNQVVTELAKRHNKSKSLVIAELVRKGL